MGVTGLWKLIEPCGKPVPVETLDGKILAVDISIWLHQAVKGFQDNKGSALPNAHLLGLFNRLCKLLYFRVKPVFVFDGCVPQLKRETIARRQQQRSKLNTEADRIQALLLQSLAKEKVVQQALGVNAELLLKSPSKRGNIKGRNEPEDIFKLPELPPSTSGSTKNNENIDESFTSMESTDDCGTSADDSSSFDESNARYAYNTNLQAIDVKSHHFKNLPADVRHEILVDIKETRKQSSWGRLHELPSRGDDFSVFQMKRLLKRRAVQESLEEAQQEMGGRTLTYAELNNLFTEEGILEPKVLEKGTKQICSDEHTRFLLVKDLKKKLGKKEESVVEIKKEEEEVKQETKSEAKIYTINEEKEEEEEILGEEFDTEMQLALAMSLETTQVYNENDYCFETNEQLRLNSKQRKRLQNAAVGPARAYMIEYGGMNDEEVEGIMDKTQMSHHENSILKELEIADKTVREKENENETLGSQTKDNQKEESEQSESENICLRVSDSSETDSDLEDVVEEEKGENTIKTKLREKENKALEIFIDLENEIKEDEDLFADVFDDKEDETKPDKKTKSQAELKSDEIITIVESQESTKSNEKIQSDEIITVLSSQESCTNEENKIDVDSSPSKMSENGAQNLDSSIILTSLKTQLNDIKKINLDDIKIENSVIEISDEEKQKTPTVNPEFLPKTPIKSEVVEICDSDDNLPSKSPNLKTPSKNRSILEYYSTDYVVKRTPEKSAEQDEDDVPKVKSPFFVNRTPKSDRKSATKSENSKSPTPTKKSATKAMKSLFEKEQEKEHEDTDGVEPIPLTPVNTEELIAEAAQMLKDQKTEEELQVIASGLAKERKDLESERNRQDRMGMSINQRMTIECQELLRLFGIPYIIAPMEAEAQCAFLDSIDLTNGTITDDSDIWLFGGRTVYKNFFAQNKHVLEFRADKIEKLFNCDRKTLVQLACLVGSDYTTGINGIGTVTAMEILASFTNGPSVKDLTHVNSENVRDIMNTVLATLIKFRDWWSAHKTHAAPIGTSTRLALLKKLKNIEMHEGFPSLAVIEAYLTPKVDENRDAFSWGYPDVESIKEYAKKTFGWTVVKTNEILTPVLKRLNDKKSQATIRNYFAIKSVSTVSDLKVSKRVKRAIEKLSGKNEDETPEKPKPKVKRMTQKKKQNIVNKGNEAKPDDDGTSVDAEPVSALIESAEEPSTSQKAVKTTRKRAAPDLHSKQSSLIPQREKDKEKMLENKKKAAEILKQEAKKSVATKKQRKS